MSESEVWDTENNCDVNELIIYLVRNRPEIWDTKHKNYKDNMMKRKLWAEIGQEMNVTDEFAKNRWRSLRDRFIKERKKLATKSGQAAFNLTTWPLMPLMTFLTDTVTPRQTVTSMQRQDASCSTASSGTEPSPTVSEYQEGCTMMESPRASNAHQISRDDNTIDAAYEKTRCTSNPRTSSVPNWNAGTSSNMSCAPQSSRSTFSQPPPAKKKKNQSSERSIDPVDEAIFSIAQRRCQTDNNLIENLTSEDFFYLSVSRDAQQLNFSARLRLKQLVLNALQKVVSEQQECE